MKIFSILLISLFLVSCTALCPQQKQAVLQDQQSFSLAFDDFQVTNRINKLQKFKTDFPDSIWADRAETIILYAQELDQRKVQIKKLRESQQQQVLNLEEFKTLNQQLTQQLEQLKGLLIQLEKHPQ